MPLSTHYQYERKHVKSAYFVKTNSISVGLLLVSWRVYALSSQRGCRAVYFSFSQVVLRLHD